ncbi:MAG: nicotinate mononucleotide-dependent phosphoribosyltransferase CobT [Cyanobacteria bacterium P01_A01_bin.114]
MSNPPFQLIRCAGETSTARAWLARYAGQKPGFLCVLGFTETALIPGISAAGATPEARRYTALADAEFLYDGPTRRPQYALPPLAVGVSPVYISRAVLAALKIPIYLFDAGLAQAPDIPHISLGGSPGRCVSTGQALSVSVVQQLFQAGWQWGEQLGQKFQGSYLIMGECVVGGTTTAQAVLTALKIAAGGKVSSSHPQNNHAQKAALIAAGLNSWQAHSHPDAAQPFTHPLAAIAAVGDPMQAALCGLALAASQYSGVLLAGGTQMVAVYALIQALTQTGTRAAIATVNQRLIPTAVLETFQWLPDRVRENIVIGTTRWVAEDSNSDLLGLASTVGPIPLLISQLSFQTARYASLQMYEQGFVKEGVGAGGCAIAASLYEHWSQTTLLAAVEDLLDRCDSTTS